MAEKINISDLSKSDIGNVSKVSGDRPPGSAADVKKLFDSNADAIVDYINNILLPVIRNVEQGANKTVVDSGYNSESDNPQSGKAVAEAILALNVPKKISDLHDNTAEVMGVALAKKAMSAERDINNNLIHTTYVKKCSIISLADSSVSINLNSYDNCEIRLTSKTLAALDIIVPSECSASSVSLSFDCCDSMQVTGNIEWVGIDCIVEEDTPKFKPQTGKHYDICIIYNGFDWIGHVNGYKPRWREI